MAFLHPTQIHKKHIQYVKIKFTHLFTHHRHLFATFGNYFNRRNRLFLVVKTMMSGSRCPSEVYPVFKKFLCILFILILAISAIPAKASESEISAPVSSFFDTPEWEGYQCVSSLVHDEGNGGTGTTALIMRKDSLDVLCIFHIKDGRWELVVKNDSILPRTDLLPIQFDSEDPN